MLHLLQDRDHIDYTTLAILESRRKVEEHILILTKYSSLHPYGSISHNSPSISYKEVEFRLKKELIPQNCNNELQVHYSEHASKIQKSKFLAIHDGNMPICKTNSCKNLFTT